HAGARQAASGADERRADARLYQRRQPRLHLDRGPLPGARPGARRSGAAALRRLLYRRLSNQPYRRVGEGRRSQPVSGGEPLASTQELTIKAQETTVSCQCMAVSPPAATMGTQTSNVMRVMFAA